MITNQASLSYKLLYLSIFFGHGITVKGFSLVFKPLQAFAIFYEIHKFVDTFIPIHVLLDRL